MGKKIHICYASDNNYAEHMLVSIYSLLYNLKKGIIANIYILDGGIEPSKRKLIVDTLSQFTNSNFKFIESNTKRYQLYNTPLHITKETFLRLELPEIFKDIDTMLYLDCDIIIDNDISGIFFDYNYEGYLGGTANDIGAYYHYKKTMRLPDIDGYFNAGVVLMNLSRMRKEKFTEKILRYLEKNGKTLLLADQDALNVFFNGKRIRIPLKYNAGDYVFYGKHIDGFTKEELKEARENTVVIHYAGEKPWKQYCSHPLKYKYYHYRNLAGLEKVQIFKKFNMKNFINHLKRYAGVWLLGNLSRKSYINLISKPKLALSKIIKF